MIIYKADKAQFVNDVRANLIHSKILTEFQRKLGKRVAENEVSSWRNSMQFMSNVLIDPEIPDDAGVSIEYNIPLTGKRVDFILSGRSQDQTEVAIIVELKQWSQVKVTSKDGIVKTYLGRGERETPHPSYQAWTYAALIEDYNQTVRDESISLRPCAYLHNLDSSTAVNDPVYEAHTSRAPVFISSDALKLSEFMKQHVRYGDNSDIMYRIEHGKIKPSKNLADSLVSMIQGNDEFLMIDEQKLVYETALQLTYKANQGKKQVLIVEGGPGTGKSVVGINLLVELTNREFVCQYVSKNAAPREVYKAKLTGTLKRGQIDNLFRGSGGYTSTEADTFSALIVDEAHRLNEKSGLFANLGENQVKELIHSAKCAIFFIDESQRVHWKDIGSKAEIKRWAEELGAEVSELELASQFRCNGSDGYLAWLDNTLQIRDTANPFLDGEDYDFRIFSNPNEMFKKIRELNNINNKSRMVAGYCWDWSSKKDPSAMDIVIPEYEFEAQWNLSKDGSLWIMAENSIDEVGCIHTCQGLELDYVGVIIGDDLLVREGKIITNGFNRSKMDASIKGFKSMLKRDKERALKTADEIIKNTYRILMTRGQKGCFVFSSDEETMNYFQELSTGKSIPSYFP